MSQVQVEQIIADRDGWFTPSQSAAYYGVPRSLNTIVLHHWNSPDQRPSFNGNLQYLLHANVPSAQDVIGFDESAGRVRIINTVEYPNVAFTSGNRINAQSAGIEIDPLIEVEGHPQQANLIAAVAQRAFDYCKITDRRLSLTAHRDYVQTSCPGNMPFDRINAALDALWNAYKNPAPVPTPTPVPAKSTYRRLDPRIWLCNAEPTQLWDLDFAKWPDAKSTKPFSKGTPVTIVGIADHPLGSQYLMTAYSFGLADQSGVPAHNTGFNKNDMVQAPDPQPIPPVPTPTPTPEPTPVPTPVPTPAPDPEQPTPHDQQQDLQITWFTGTLKSLLALLREFAQNILSKFGKE